MTKHIHIHLGKKAPSTRSLDADPYAECKFRLGQKVQFISASKEDREHGPYEVVGRTLGGLLDKTPMYKLRDIPGMWQKENLLKQA